MSRARYLADKLGCASADCEVVIFVELKHVETIDLIQGFLGEVSWVEGIIREMHR